MPADGGGPAGALSLREDDVCIINLGPPGGAGLARW